MTEQASQPPFTPTRWSLVLRARGKTPEARAALSELCEAYYQPVFRFLRREGRDEATALDLTQAFFAKILEKGSFSADQDRGRFRSYVLGAVKHFLADERKRELREKRGSGQVPQSLDDEEQSFTNEAAYTTEALPDAWFDRQWALNVMDRALSDTEMDWIERGKKDQFAILKSTLMGTGQAARQSELAERLGWSGTATKVAIHRLRKQLRARVRTEIANTIPESTDVDSELEYLIQVLGHTPQ